MVSEWEDNGDNWRVYFDLPYDRNITLQNMSGFSQKESTTDSFRFYVFTENPEDCDDFTLVYSSDTNPIPWTGDAAGIRIFSATDFSTIILFTDIQICPW